MAIPYFTKNEGKKLDERVKNLENGGGGSSSIATFKNSVFDIKTLPFNHDPEGEYSTLVIVTKNDNEMGSVPMRREDIEFIINEVPMAIHMGRADEEDNPEGFICGAHIIRLVENFGGQFKAVNYSYADTYEMHYCNIDNVEFWYDSDEDEYHIDIYTCPMEANYID